MTQPNDPAYPCTQIEYLNYPRQDWPGLTAIERAAILLRVPTSGNEWLDDMIREARRWDMATTTVQGLLINEGYANRDEPTLANYGTRQADALMIELETKGGE